jgi:hypothetical protein
MLTIGQSVPVIAYQRAEVLLLRHHRAKAGYVALVRHARNVNLNTSKSIESR